MNLSYVSDLVLGLDEPVQVLAVLLPFLTLDLLLSSMASSIDRIKVLLAYKLLSGLFAVRIEDGLERIEGCLHSSFGRYLPVTDRDFMVAKIAIFEHTNIVAIGTRSSQCPYATEEGFFL